jgi:SNF2 family DNA or RNA helicase
MAQLTWNSNEQAITFQCLEQGNLLPVDSWGRHEITTIEGKNGSVGALFLSIDSDVSQIRERVIVEVPHQAVAQFESHQLAQLGLPKSSTLRLHIRGEGNISRPDFLFRYHYSKEDGTLIMGPKRKGALLSFGSSNLIISDPTFTLIEMMDKYNALPIEGMEERFHAWGKIKEILPGNVIVDDFLSAINVAPAEAFTLEILDSTSLTFNPVLVKGAKNLPSEDLHDEKKQPFINLLPPEPQSVFNKQFWKSDLVRQRYALGDGWFVTLPPTLKRVLSIAHAYNDKPIAEKRAFLSNPREAMAREMGDDLPGDILENLFYESPEFLSDRIKYLGVWQPKSGVFLLPSEQDWLAGNEILGIPIGDRIVRVSTKNLQSLIADVKEAQHNNIKTIEHEGQTIPVTDEAIEALVKGLPEQKPTSNTLQEENNNEIKDKQEKIVPIIIDHLSELGFAKNTKTRSGEFANPPKGLKTSLIKHQKKGLHWLQKSWETGRPGCLLADDMGLGKTFQALVFMAGVKELMIKKTYAETPMLIVAPTGLLINWEEEIDKHLLPPGLGGLYRAYGSGMRSLRGITETQASQQLQEYDLVLTTYETLRDYVRIFIKVPWSIVTFDEIQKIKNPAALITDMAKSLDVDFSIGLTGTPIENRLADLWCIIDTLYPSRLQTLKAFSQKYESKDRDKQAEQCLELKELLEGEEPEIMLRRMKEDHLEGLPREKSEVFEIAMPPLQADAYHNVLNEARSSVSEPGSMLKALQALRSISLHPHTSLDSDIDDDYINNSARLKATIEILDAVFERQEKALVFLESLDMQQLLVPYLQKRYRLSTPPMLINGKVSGQKRQERVGIFQDKSNKDFDIMILSPKAGGVGLTLTAANHVIHLSRWWNPAVEDQCTDRVFRIGQHKDVTVYYPLAVHPNPGEPSFDKNLHNLLEKKRQLSRDVLTPPAGTDQDLSDFFGNTVMGNTDPVKNTMNFNQIDILEPLSFERFVLRELTRQGYEGRTTPVTGDHGADGIALAPKGSGKCNLIIQCKHTQGTKPCPEDAVLEIVNSLGYYQDIPEPFKAVVVTNAHGFTQSAIEIASRKSVLLVDRFSLLKWLEFPS